MMSSALFFSVLLSYLLVFAHGGSETSEATEAPPAEECPQFDCQEPSCWEQTSPVETYVYLDDGTKCPGCKRCVENRPLDPEAECPPIGCPMWRIPAECKPEFYAMKFEYNDNECDACDAFICTGEDSR